MLQRKIEIYHLVEIINIPNFREIQKDILDIAGQREHFHLMLALEESVCWYGWRCWADVFENLSCNLNMHIKPYLLGSKMDGIHSEVLQ